MRGKLLVCLYSVFLIVLFGVCCYLMSIVNPKPFPENDARRKLTVNHVEFIDPLPSQDNPNYGLEKIPEGVDADEYRKIVTTIVAKHVDKDDTPVERGQKVVPPLWPNGYRRNMNEKIEDEKHQEPLLHKSSTAKGIRRSVNGNIYDEPEYTKSILLKIIDGSGVNKFDIKIISKDNNINRNISKIAGENATSNQSSIYKDDAEQSKALQIKGNDIILLSVADDLSLLLNNNVSLKALKAEINNEQKSVENTSESNIDMSVSPKYERHDSNREESYHSLTEMFSNQEMFTFNLINSAVEVTASSEDATNGSHILSSTVSENENNKLDNRDSPTL